MKIVAWSLSFFFMALAFNVFGDAYASERSAKRDRKPASIEKPTENLDGYDCISVKDDKGLHDSSISVRFEHESASNSHRLEYKRSGHPDAIYKCRKMIADTVPNKSFVYRCGYPDVPPVNKGGSVQAWIDAKDSSVGYLTFWSTSAPTDIFLKCRKI